MIKGPSLIPGESLLLTQERIKTFSVRCGNEVSWFCAIPLLVKWTLFITNRRIHFATTAMSRFTGRKDFWFPDGNSEPRRDIVMSVDGSKGLKVTVAVNTLLGRITHLFKFGFKDADKVVKLIEEQMKTANTPSDATR